MSDNSVRCAIYVRISHDQAGDEHGVKNQTKDAEKAAAGGGLTVAARYSDNDLSASSGDRRPDYEAMMAAAASGEFATIIVFQTSRLWRNRRERAEGIEILRKAAVSVVAVRGPSLDMSTAYGRAMAGLLGEFDTMETDVKSERQEAAALHRAENGQVPLGVRLTGYTKDGKMVEREAAMVGQLFAMFHSGASIRELTRWANKSGVKTRGGGTWAPTTVRTILVNPRYCGRAVYRGEANGHRGAWEPIVGEDVFDAVGAMLADPRRRNQAGTHRVHLGSGLYECAVCRRKVQSQTGSGVLRYRCPDRHVSRTAEPIDRMVLAVVRGRLGRSDLAGLLARPDDERSAELAAEVTRLRARVRRIENDYDRGDINGRRFKVATGKAAAELDAALSAQARLAAPSGIAGLLTAPDPVAAFDAAPLGVQQAVVAFFIDVRLAHVAPGRHFDPDSVKITPAVL